MTTIAGAVAGQCAFPPSKPALAQEPLPAYDSARARVDRPLVQLEMRLQRVGQDDFRGPCMPPSGPYSADGDYTPGTQPTDGRPTDDGPTD